MTFGHTSASTVAPSPTLVVISRRASIVLRQMADFRLIFVVERSRLVVLTASACRWSEMVAGGSTSSSMKSTIRLFQARQKPTHCLRLLIYTLMLLELLP